MRLPDQVAPLPLVHGLFYVITGFWPVVHVRSFEVVTGPKTDDWLVKAAGALIGVIGLAILTGGSKEPTPDGALLAIGSAAALATVDAVYVKKRIIRPIYLGDAVVEIGLALAWIASLGRHRAARQP